jgi:hypothetical protein
MISCKRAAELISLSQEAPLRWRQRLALALHLCVCGMCRRFRRQMGLLERAGRSAPGTGPGASADVALPAEAKERIKRALRGQGPGGPGEKTL